MVLREVYTFCTVILQHICEGGGLMSYMAMYMDTIPKLLNHLLFGLGICNVFLLFVAMSGDYATARISIHSFFISILLCSQTASVWRILNHGQYGVGSNSGDGRALLTPSEFLVGVALGITIGGAIISFVVSRYFGQLSTQCDKEQLWINQQNVTNPAIVSSILRGCAEYRKSILAVWFWSGMVFWFNMGVAILIATGRNELTNFYGGGAAQYETIGTADDGGGGPHNTPVVSGYQHQQQQQQQQQQIPIPGSAGTVNNNRFAGNYPSVPEVRGAPPSPTTGAWDAPTASDPLSSHQHSRPAT